MYRYIIIAVYPPMCVVCALAAYRSRLLSRNFPSEAWLFKRHLMVGFALLQVYGAIRVFTVNRVFTWADLIYLTGLLLFCLGLDRFDRLLLRDARGLRAKAIKILVPLPPASGDLPPEFWKQVFTEVVRQNIKPEYLVEVELVDS